MEAINSCSGKILIKQHNAPISKGKLQQNGTYRFEINNTTVET